MINNIPLIILAAGKSSRMGHPKGLTPINNSSIIKEQINSFRTAGGKDVHIVLGHHIEEYTEHLKNFDVSFIINKHYKRGQFSSVKMAVDNLGNQHENLLIAPVDLLPLNYDTWNLFIKNNECQIPSFKKQKGHPVLLNKEIINKINYADFNSRLDHIIRDSKHLIFEVNDKNVITNVNFLKDLN